MNEKNPANQPSGDEDDDAANPGAAAPQPQDVAMVSVNSSNLAAVGLDANGTMTAQFKNGESYTYPGVSPAKFKEMLGAASPGKYFYQNFRDRTGTPLGTKKH